MIVYDPDLAGLNVTIPFKADVIRYLDEIDPVAESIQAVNCIKITRNRKKMKLAGFNTDSAAFRDTLKPLLQKQHRRALVLGTGGAARAVCHALNDLNIEFTLVSRAEKPGVLTYADTSHRIITNHKVIINATPVGMFPDESHCPYLPYDALTTRHLLYDLNYNPEETLFLKKGIEAGALVKNGLEMLHLQAELSWKTWSL